MSETISISASAAAIFCSDESWGRPPKRKDILCDLLRVYNRKMNIVDVKTMLMQWVVCVVSVVDAGRMDLNDDVALRRGSKDLEWSLGCSEARAVVSH